MVIMLYDTSSLIFLSTLSLRRATAFDVLAISAVLISIHALLAESDANWFDLWGWAEYFYPRSPCGERRVVTAFRGSVDNFYPRSPCGERRAYTMIIIICIASFLSTLSLRRATLRVVDGSKSSIISIHALLAESDCIWRT